MTKASPNEGAEKIFFTDQHLLKNLCGEHDKNLKFIEKLEPVKVKAWGNSVTISGPNGSVHKIKTMLQQLYALMEKGWHIQSADIDYAHRILTETLPSSLPVFS